MQEVQSSKVNWDWISQAWQLFTANAVTWVVMMLIVGVFALICYLPIIIAGAALAVTTSTVDYNDPAAVQQSIGSAGTALGVMSIVGSITMIVMFVGMIFLGAGLLKTAIKQTRGEQISVKDLFSGKDKFIPLLGYGLLIGVGMMIVFAVIMALNFIIPILFLLIYPIMFVVMGILFFAIPQIIDGRAGVIDAIKISIEKTKQDLLMYILLTVVVGFIAGAGILALGIGILVTYPLAILVPAVAYRDVFGLAGSGMPSPPPPPDHWMNNPR